MTFLCPWQFGKNYLSSGELPKRGQNLENVPDPVLVPEPFTKDLESLNQRSLENLKLRIGGKDEEIGLDVCKCVIIIAIW